jgi:hypothetical protein
MKGRQMSKTRKAEKIIMRFARKQRGPFRLNQITRKYRGKLPMTFARWNLRQRGELVRVKPRGFFTLG